MFKEQQKISKDWFCQIRINKVTDCKKNPRSKKETDDIAIREPSKNAGFYSE